MGDTQSTLVALAATPWGLLIVFAATLIDGFFPPIPSETAIIAVSAVLVAGGDGAMLVLVYVAAVAGALCGDSVAYVIGKNVDVQRLPFLRGRRGRRALEWASRGLEKDGGPIIVAARYIPVARVAVSMTAAALKMSYRRFALFDAAAVALWVAYTMVIGVLAGAWMQDHPLLGAGIGIIAGIALGALIGRAVSKRAGSREE